MLPQQRIGCCCYLPSGSFPLDIVWCLTFIGSALIPNYKGKYQKTGGWILILEIFKNFFP